MAKPVPNALTIVKREIATYKKRIMRKCRRIGGAYEYQGHKEYRALCDKYAWHLYERDGVQAEIERFYDWCEEHPTQEELRK